jgi:hypothetical protein
MLKIRPPEWKRINALNGVGIVEMGSEYSETQEICM